MTAFRFDSVALRRVLVLISLPLVALVLAGVVGARDDRSSDATLRELRIFSEVLQLAGRNYVDDLDVAQLERGAYQGLAESLDPWSSFHDSQKLAQLERGDRSGSIGVLLLKHPQQYVRIVVVVPGSPADLAGVKSGQFLETIDGRATKDIALVEAEAMLRGAPGTSVKLGFFRSSDEEERGKVLDITRKDLSDLRVVEQRLDATTALVRLTDLRPGVAALLGPRLAALREAGVTGLVLDLRTNVGGSPDEAIAVADLLAPPGEAFQRVTKAGASTASTRDAVAWAGGLVVLVERGTVGEAELLAEALRKLQGAKLIGRPTLGKTTQQDLVQLSGGMGLSLSIAEYRRADGTPFDVDGLEPDEKVLRGVKDLPEGAGTDGTAPDAEEELEPGEPEAAPPEPEAPRPGAAAPADAEDAQVKRALEILKAAGTASPAGEAAPARKAA